MPADDFLSPIVAATTQWLVQSYPPAGGALQRGLAEAQARQAVTVAALLRYPTELDAELVAFSGPGGASRLDWITGADATAPEHAEAWRSWVDEVVTSWAACLLGSPALASLAAGAVVEAHGDTAPVAFRRLTDPTEEDHRSAALLRHPDVLAPIADLHGAELRDRLRAALPT
ncbi:hypothetical protein [Streptomyces sp. NK15101]|uniref:hypothetical protein n=1 Tax=Streptomyces sp. NK15101 TaxID=2873261 RepID=UPI001CECFE8D|nr:hypothetical protein [Streptomyces sp. NK15101]